MLGPRCRELGQRCGISLDPRHELYQRHEASMAVILPLLAPLVGALLISFSLWDVLIDIPHAGWTLLMRCLAALGLQALVRIPAARISMKWRLVILYWTLLSSVEACGAILSGGYTLALPGVVLCVLFASMLTMRWTQFLLLLSLPTATFVALGLLLLEGRDLVSSFMFYALAVLMSSGVLLVKGALRVEAYRNEERLLHLSRHDAMTGAHNRAHTSELAIREFAAARRYHKALSVAMIDIDHFKRVNDEYGHDAGDCVIKAVAASCTGCMRAIDHFGRWGGEEFLVILPESDAAAAWACAERLRKAVEALRVDTAAGTLGCTVSVGVATLHPGFKDWEALVKQADVALYAAKTNGRNRVEAAAAANDSLSSAA